VVAGSAVHLLVQGADGVAHVGTLGGVAGLLAAVILLFQTSDNRLISRKFGLATFAVLAVVAVLALAGGEFLGSAMRWEAVVGGYIAGAALMRAVLVWRVGAARG
jgi:membrane associated rhomboid family serine protease